MSDPSESNPLLERWLSDVTELAASVRAEQVRPDADEFLDRVEQLRVRFAPLIHPLTQPALQRELSAYAEHRFELVDRAEEYARATEELLTLSLVLSDAPELAAPALQRGIVRLSAVLSEPGAPRLFARLLRRLRELARQSGSVELRAWVDGVVAALPD